MENNKLHDLKNYKMSKVLVKDLTEILNIMNQFHVKLNKYIKYTAIKKMTANLQENKAFIRHHLEKQKKILNEKGLVEEKEVKK